MFCPGIRLVLFERTESRATAGALPADRSGLDKGQQVNVIVSAWVAWGQPQRVIDELGRERYASAVAQVRGGSGTP
jgi:hypothetical protein